MIRWGISYNEFIKTPYEILLKLLKYEEAKTEGLNRRK
jgi:hypothetical protein